MQDLFIEFLPPWVETNLQPAFYDAESGTILQQVSRMYAKMNEIIASINNMDKVIKEYIDYIDNYFKNLDVQEEIDNKLDEMAESGDLAEYIAQYANLPCIHAYATIADMASSENLVDGSYARAMSKTVAGTGDGFYYKIRDIEPGDDPDGENLVAVGATLVAEKIPDASINDLSSSIDSVEEDISDLNTEISKIKAQNRKVIIIGDSYANRTNSWADRIKSQAGLADADCNIKKYSGSGFINAPDGVTFESLLTTGITINPAEVTDIIVCGGWNDNGYTKSNIKNAIASFIDTAIANYPNANIYIGYISWFNLDYSGISESVPYSGVVNGVHSYIEGCNYSTKCHYLNNVEYSLHNPAYIDDSTFHPTSDGQQAIADNVMRAWITGSTSVCTSLSNITSTFTTASGITASPDFRFYTNIDNQISRLTTTVVARFQFDNETQYTLGAGRITLGTIKGGYVYGRGSVTTATCATVVKTTSGTYYKLPTTLDIQNGVISWRPKVLNSTNNGWLTSALDYVEFDMIKFDVDSVEQY